MQDKANLTNISTNKLKFEISPKPSSTFFECKNLITMFAIAFSLSTSVALAIIVISGHLTTATDESYKENLLVNPDENPGRYVFIDRQKWGGKTLPIVRQLQHPVSLVIIAHTVTPFCSTFEKCSERVSSIQMYHIWRGFSDIAYNFLIGGDGHVYVGRGWDGANEQRNQSISVSFIGNFIYDYLTEEMVEALQILLSEGVELKKLKKDYKIVCHNQTTATLSPGDHVYEVIQQLSHFQPGNTRS